MRKYIFITTESSTYQPTSDSPQPDIEDLQIIGIRQGNMVHDAFIDLPGLHEYLVENSFDEIFASELKSNNRKYFPSMDTRKKYMSAS